MEKPTQKIEGLEALKQEIMQLKINELAKKQSGGEYSRDIVERVNPDKLDNDDLAAYLRFKKKDFNPKTFAQEKKSLMIRISQKDKTDISALESSRGLHSYLSHQLFLPENMEWYAPEEYKRLFGNKESN